MRSVPHWRSPLPSMFCLLVFSRVFKKRGARVHLAASPVPQVIGMALAVPRPGLEVVDALHHLVPERRRDCADPAEEDLAEQQAKQQEGPHQTQFFVGRSQFSRFVE